MLTNGNCHNDEKFINSLAFLYGTFMESVLTVESIEATYSTYTVPIFLSSLLIVESMELQYRTFMESILTVESMELQCSCGIIVDRISYVYGDIVTAPLSSTLLYIINT
jgi:hypothetical protein